MLRHMADRNHRLTVEARRKDAVRDASHAIDVTRIRGNSALAGEVRDQAEFAWALPSGFRSWAQRAQDESDCGPWTSWLTTDPRMQMG
jgi:hypothetical protein